MFEKMKRLIQKLKGVRLEEICNGEYTYYDKNAFTKCGKILNYKMVECEYFKKDFCNNDYYTNTIIKYIKK